MFLNCPPNLAPDKIMFQNQRLYVSCSKAQTPSSGLDELSVDPERLRLYSRKPIFRNHTSIHRKPEDLLAIHCLKAWAF